MTIEEFNKYNETKTMPCEDIGQGNGYKDFDFDWETGNPKDIIYIPEYGYEADGTVKRENAYSKQDIIDAVRECCTPEDAKKTKKISAVAQNVFETVDWQFPTTLLVEWDYLFDPEDEDYAFKED